MKYLGSKRRIAKEIYSVISKYCNINKNVYFYDVFCGGGNFIQFVPLKYRIAIDIDEYVIEALKIIRDCPFKLPKNNTEFTEKDYYTIRDNKNKYPKWLVGYVGYALSWGGKWFGGWRRDKSKRRDFVKEAFNSALKQSKLIKDVEFICDDYLHIQYKNSSILYFDPPYINTTKYKTNFNFNQFWKFVRYLSKNGFICFVSEYQAPQDFICIWQKTMRVNIKNSKKCVEKLFIYKEYK